MDAIEADTIEGRLYTNTSQSFAQIVFLLHQYESVANESTTCAYTTQCMDMWDSARFGMPASDDHIVHVGWITSE